MSDAPASSNPPPASATAASAAPTRLRLYTERDGEGDVRSTFLIQSEEGLSLWIEPKLAEPAQSAQSDAPGVPAARSPEARFPDARPISALALSVIFGRYGKPLEEGLDLTSNFAADDAADAPLSLLAAAGQRARLRRFRFMPFGWVHPADYLLWEVDGEEPVAAPAPLVTSALSALARVPVR